MLATVLSTCVLPSEPRTSRIQFVLPSDTLLVATGSTAAPQIGVLVDGKFLSGARIRLESGDSSLATIVGPNQILGRRRGSDPIRVQLVSAANGASPPETSFVAHVIVGAMRPALGDTVRGRATLLALGDSLVFRPGYLAADNTPLSPGDSATITPRNDLAAGGLSGRAVRLDSATGRIIAVANGTDTIRASVDTAHAYLVVTVRQRAARVQVSPGSVQLHSLTQTQQLGVTAWDRRDSLIAQPVVTWSSTTPGVVLIGATSGLATAVANGTAGILARVDSVADTAGVTVQQLPGKLAFNVQPNQTVAGALISPAVQVTVQDSLGAPIANVTTLVTLAIGTNPAGGTLAGTVSRSAVNGVAVFSDLSIASAGAGYTLTATGSGLAGATSAGFDIDLGPATKLAFTVQPTTTIAGSIVGPAVRVAIQDALGNTVPGAAAAITLTLGTAGVAGATLSGTTTVSTVGGVATFSDLSLNKAGGNFTLTASNVSFTSATSAAFAITGGAAATLAFTAPPRTTAAGDPMTPAPQVTAVDVFGNLATGAVTMAIVSGTGAVGAQLRGTRTVPAVNGVATFPDLSVDKAATGYVLAASATGATAATSTGFDIIPGTAATLAFTRQPVTTSAGASLTPAVQVAVQDSLGNTLTSATPQITVAIGTNPGGATLAGTPTQSAVNGTATFADLSFDKAGTGYTLTASAASLAGATSAAMSITPGAAAALVFTVHPGTTPQAVVITPAVQVAVRDAFGNTVTGFSGPVTAAIAPGTGTVGATLSGTPTVAAVSGVATFGDLSIDSSGSNYALTSTSAGLTAATSTTFAVTMATNLVFTVQPTSTTSNTVIVPAIQVTAYDDFGHAVTSWTGSVTLSITSGTGAPGAGLGGTRTVTAIGGIATFSDLSVSKTHTGYTLTARATGLASVASTPFDIQ